MCECVCMYVCKCVCEVMCPPLPSPAQLIEDVNLYRYFLKHFIYYSIFNPIYILESESFQQLELVLSSLLASISDYFLMLTSFFAL